jgi:hypothetical protein
MKFVKVIFVLLVAAAISAGAFWQFYLKEQHAFAQLATAYSAKMVCSCRFVAEREMASCLGDFTDDISQLTITENDHTITSKAPLGLSKDMATFEPGLGCTLVRP